MTLDQKLHIIYLILGSVLAWIVYFMQNGRRIFDRFTNVCYNWFTLDK